MDILIEAKLKFFVIIFDILMIFFHLKDSTLFQVTVKGPPRPRGNNRNLALTKSEFILNSLIVCYLNLDCNGTIFQIQIEVMHLQGIYFYF